MSSSQQIDVGLPNTHSLGPQTASQPSNAQIETDGDLGTGRDSKRTTAEESEPQAADLRTSMRVVADLTKKLGIAAVATSLHRGQQLEVLKQNPRALRTYESTQVDGAWILGDVDKSMANLTYAERIGHLGLLSGNNIRKQSLAFYRGESVTDPPSSQSSQASVLHVNVL